MTPMSTSELSKLSRTLARAIAIDEVNQLGRTTGQATRLRTVTPHRLFLAVVSALGSGRVESLADLLRAFNHQQGVTVAYKAFDNRLARVGFATFMQQMLARLIAQLRLETLTPDGERAIARFTDIVIQDGTSFAVKPALATTFPGRFTTIEPQRSRLGTATTRTPTRSPPRTKSTSTSTTRPGCRARSHARRRAGATRTRRPSTHAAQTTGL